MARKWQALEIIAAVCRTDLATFAPETELVADLRISSATALTLMVELEERLGIEILEEQALGLQTVGDILALLGGSDGPS